MYHESMRQLRVEGERWSEGPESKMPDGHLHSHKPIIKYKVRGGGIA